jgi:hypothetical protein
LISCILTEGVIPAVLINELPQGIKCIGGCWDGFAGLCNRQSGHTASRRQIMKKVSMFYILIVVFIAAGLMVLYITRSRKEKQPAGGYVQLQQPERYARLQQPEMFTYHELVALRKKPKGCRQTRGQTPCHNNNTFHQQRGLLSWGQTASSEPASIGVLPPTTDMEH